MCCTIVAMSKATSASWERAQPLNESVMRPASFFYNTLGKSSNCQNPDAYPPAQPGCLYAGLGSCFVSNKKGMQLKQG
jgi:hypothetical protein